jgi:hypothetical protein
VGRVRRHLSAGWHTLVLPSGDETSRSVITGWFQRVDLIIARVPPHGRQPGAVLAPERWAQEQLKTLQ